MILTALTIVLLVQLVGIILVIALLSIPGATVSRFTKTLSGMMIYASIAGLLFILSGLILSYEPQLPAGATIIQVAVLCYAAVLLVTAMMGWKRQIK
jgi:zinc transport system permease protein